MRGDEGDGLGKRTGTVVVAGVFRKNGALPAPPLPPREVSVTVRRAFQDAR